MHLSAPNPRVYEYPRLCFFQISLNHVCWKCGFVICLISLTHTTATPVFALSSLSYPGSVCQHHVSSILHHPLVLLACCLLDTHIVSLTHSDASAFRGGPLAAQTQGAMSSPPVDFDDSDLPPPPTPPGQQQKPPSPPIQTGTPSPPTTQPSAPSPRLGALPTGNRSTDVPKLDAQRPPQIKAGVSAEPQKPNSTNRGVSPTTTQAGPALVKQASKEQNLPSPVPRGSTENTDNKSTLAQKRGGIIIHDSSKSE